MSKRDRFVYFLANVNPGKLALEFHLTFGILARMKNSSFIQLGLLSLAVLATFRSGAFTLSLTEQGTLSGFIVGGGGVVTITPIGTDHWTVSIQDPRIGNPAGPPFALAFTEPETVNNLTAYNNIQLLSLSPGNALLDVLSDEFSPYANIFPNNATALVQSTDVEPFALKFNDIADSAPEPSSVTLLLGAGVLAYLKRFRANTNNAQGHFASR